MTPSTVNGKVRATVPPRSLRLWLRCPHHARYCDGRRCCCADRHWHADLGMRDWPRGLRWVGRVAQQVAS